MGLLVVTIIWGSGFIASQYALDAGVGPAAVMAGRFLVAAVLIGAVCHRRIRRAYKKGQWKAGAIVGLFLYAGFYVQTLGLANSTPANNAFITSSYVVMVPLLWWAVAKKRPHPIVFAACLVSLAGVAILSLDLSAGLRVGFGDALTLLSALLFAAQIVATGHFARDIDPVVLVFMQLAVAAVCGCATFALVDRDLSFMARPGAVLAVAYLGAFSTCLCYFLQTVAQRHLSSTRTGILLATEALFGAVFSVLAGYDSASPRMLVGGLVMLVSVLLPSLRLFTQRRQPRPDGEKGPGPPAEGG